MSTAHTLKTVFLLTTLSALLMFVGGALGGRGGLMLALVFSLGINFSSWFFSDRIVLARHRAQPVGPGDASGLHAMVSELAARAQLPMPAVYIIPDPSPNAFATGRDPHHAAVAVTQGLLQTLSRRELRGVVAHELAHVENRDTLVMTVVASVASAIMFLASMGRWALIFGGGNRDNDDGALGALVALFVAPFAATLVQLGISRQREFLADARGAEIAGDSEGLALALEKISAIGERVRAAGYQGPVGSAPAQAHLYISPAASVRQGLGGLFRTHPTTEDRVRRLRSGG